jgi:alginate O-acetyltransferase complex protein AlgI
MSFATPVFLWVFMPVVLAVSWVLPARHRNAVLAVSSLVFYAYGAKEFLVLLVASIIGNYVAGLAIDRATSDRARNTVLAVAVTANIAALGFWKYAGFLSRQVDALVDVLGGTSRLVVSIALPIGISFFTFHCLSYLIDVWRGRSAASRRPLDFVTYIAMFPQLVAGPIVRYHDIQPQLEETQRNRADDLAAGFPRFAWGLFKKLAIADTLGPVADTVFGLRGGALSTTSAWLGVVAYTLQLYFDFSGYTDMAIGLGRMFGFRFPENFARPYSALSITDFWRRWHMSLSQWFRDYVYIPLGGNRGPRRRTNRNLWIVFLLTGIWHGAAWTFVLWGAYHGALLVHERGRSRYRDAHGRAPDATSIGHALLRVRALLLVMIGWVLFRAPDVEQALRILRSMFLPNGFTLEVATDAVLTNQRLLVLALASVVFVLPRGFVVGPLLDRGRDAAAGWVRFGVCAVAAPVAVVLAAAGTFSPFLYYQF